MRRARLALVPLLALLYALASQAADSDLDGVDDLFDNCTDVPNASQANRDYDRFGNACDGDVDQDGDADADDQTLVYDEAADPDDDDRLVADFDDDGDVDLDDRDYFDANLMGVAPGPAGPKAHDANADGILEFCSAPASGSFPGKWDPVAHPNVLVNGEITGVGPQPPGWADPVEPNTVHQTGVRLAGDGAWQWTSWGQGGASGGCGKSCIQPFGSGPGDRVPIDPSRRYAFSFYMCAPDFPPTTVWVLMEEFDASGVNISEGGITNNSRSMNSDLGRWEESIFFYQPSSSDVASVAPRIFRDKRDPAEKKQPLFFDDFAFWQLDEDANRVYRSPPATKRPFLGSQTEVDALGNARIHRNGQWQDYIPLGIYAAPSVLHAVDFGARYSDAGFNLAMNERARFGNAAIAEQAADATSAFNPDGMSFMFFSHIYHKGQADLDELDSNLATIGSAVSPGGVQVSEQLFAYNYDNEGFNRCGTPDPLDSTICLDDSMWDAQEEPLTRIFEWDRGLTSPTSERAVPSYLLNGNSSVARAYTRSGKAKVGGWLDFRMDVTSSYGVSQVRNLEHLDGQLAPTIMVQVQTSTFDRYRPIAWGGIALGARGFGTWRDWDCSSSSPAPCGPPYKSPTLVLCGATDFGLQARGHYFTAPGHTWTTVRGASSQAEAEILSGPGEAGGCPGGAEGAAYRIHPRVGEFEAGETVIEVGVGILPGATILKNPKPGIVDYDVSIVDRDWWLDLPQLRSEIDALADAIALPHDAFSPNCHATDGQGAVVPFGSTGIVCGTRGGGPFYVILANTYHEIDPYADWGQQYVGDTLTVEITPTGLPNAPSELRPFDPATLQFTTSGSLFPSNGTFTATLPSFGTRVYQVYFPSGCGLLGIEPFLMLGAVGVARRVGSARRCRTRTNPE